MAVIRLFLLLEGGWAEGVGVWMGWGRQQLWAEHRSSTFLTVQKSCSFDFN